MVTREEILEVASNRMMQYGIQKTTMHEIAHDLGIAVGTLYLYFKNKEEIVLAIASNCRRQQAETAEEILSSSLSPEEKFREFLLQKFHHIQNFRNEQPHSKEFIRLLIQLDPCCVQTWRERFEENLVCILQEGVEKGVFHIADARNEASVLFLCLRSFYPLPFLELPIWPTEEDLLRVLDWCIERLKAAHLHVPV